jgi:hypothetical protein
MDLIDAPRWIIERFSKNTIAPGFYLVAVACIKECIIYGARSFNFIKCYPPQIYFIAVHVNHGLNWFFLYNKDNPKQIGMFLDESDFKENFMIVERLL